MNTSLYLGKSYLAGDGDNTISALLTCQDTERYHTDKIYGGDPMATLILQPISVSKPFIDYYISRDESYNLMEVSKHAGESVSSTWVISFSVPSAIPLDQSSSLTGLLGGLNFSTGKNPHLSVNMGSIVKYYDVDKGNWIYETVCRKEIKGYGTSNGSNIDGNRPYEIIIGTKSKPELIKIEKKTSDDPTFTIDLKTGNENNVTFTDA